MPILDRLSGLVNRGNSDKNLNANTQANAAPVISTAPIARTYEIPAETAPVIAAPLGQTAVHNNVGLNGGLNNNNSSGIYTTAGSYNSLETGNRLSTGLVRAEPTIIETIEKPVVIQERIHPMEKEEIQPIIYREREQLDVKQVTQLLHETHIEPTLVQQRELAAEVRAPIVERGAPIQENIILPTTQRDATLRTQQIHAPIIEETIKKTIIEEIQPVLERDVYVPTIVQNTQPIYEKIVEAPTVYRETRTVQELGTRETFVPQYVAPVEIVREVAPIAPAPLQVVPITTTTTVETYDHKMNPIETRDFVNNRGLPLR